MATFVSLWQLLGAYGNFWELMATYENFSQLWQHLATYGNFWQGLATFGNLWELLAVHGYFWHIMVPFGNFCQHFGDACKLKSFCAEFSFLQNLYLYWIYAANNLGNECQLNIYVWVQSQSNMTMFCLKNSFLSPGGTKIAIFG